MKLPTISPSGASGLPPTSTETAAPAPSAAAPGGALATRTTNAAMPQRRAALPGPAVTAEAVADAVCRNARAGQVALKGHYDNETLAAAALQAARGLAALKGTAR
jgi:hypothetical protein